MNKMVCVCVCVCGILGMLESDQLLAGCGSELKKGAESWTRRKKQTSQTRDCRLFGPLLTVLRRQSKQKI